MSWLNKPKPEALNPKPLKPKPDKGSLLVGFSLAPLRFNWDAGCHGPIRFLCFRMYSLRLKVVPVYGFRVWG